MGVADSGLIPLLDAIDSSSAQRSHLRGLSDPRERALELLDAARDVRRTDPRRSSQLARWATALSVRLQDAPLCSLTLRISGQALLVLGNPLAALRRLERAHALAAPDKKHALAIDIAQCLTALGRSTQAREVLANARAALGPDAGATPEDVASKASMIDMIEANILQRLDQFEEARRMLESARKRLAGAEQSPLAVAIEGNLANVLSNLGAYDEADAAYEAARQYYLRVGRKAAALACEYNRAYLWSLQGRFDESLSLLTRLISDFEAIGDERHVGLALLDKSEIQLHLGGLDAASKSAARAEEILRRLGHAPDAAKATFFRGVVQGQLAEPEVAINALTSAVEELDKAESAGWAAICRQRLAEAHIRAGDVTRGVDLASDAAATLYNVGLLERGGHAEMIVSNAEIDRGDFGTARDRVAGIAARTQGLFAPWLECELEHRAGLCDEALGDFVAARSHFLRAIRLLDRHRMSVPPDEYMTSFLHSRAAVYADAVRVLSEVADSDEHTLQVFEVMDAAKGRALLDLVEGRAKKLSQSGDAERAALLRELEGVQARIGSTEDRVLVGATQRRAKIVHDRQARLRKRERELRAAAGRGLFGGDSPSLDVDRLRALLGVERTMVQFFVSDRQVYVAVLSTSSLTIRKLPATWPMIQQLVASVRFQLERPQALADAYTPQIEERLLVVVTSVLRELGDALFQPILDLLHTKQLVIVPHLDMHALPFAAIQIGDETLIDRFEVVVSSSAGLYQHCAARAPSDAVGAAFFSVPDEYAPRIADEVASVAALYDNAQTFSNDQATTDALREAASTSRVLHVATHGRFNEDNPMASGLLLADGWMEAHELYDLDLRSDVVTLSGCATGRSWVSDADELLGVARGLLYAGARTLVMSLWDVHDDSAQHYMFALHRGIAAGESVACAARSAALETRTRHRHPTHWAPFVVSGGG